MSPKSGVLLLAAALAVGLAGPARADVSIGGDPLTIAVSTTSNLAPHVRGASEGAFYGDSASGFFLAFPSSSGGPSAGKVYGPALVPAGTSSRTDTYTPVSQSDVTGNGTAGSPYVSSTTYAAGDLADVIQTVTYVEGTSRFHVRWSVVNRSDTTLPFRASTGADLYIADSDVGFGRLIDDGHGRFVGGSNHDGTTLGGLVEDARSPWSHYMESGYGTIWQRVGSADTDLDDTVAADDYIDNGVAVEWSRYRTSGLAPGATATFDVDWDLGRGVPVGAMCPYGPRRVGDTNCDGSVRVAVVGDSYISGEGTADYFDGTDDHSVFGSRVDLCHRSAHTWAIQLAEQLLPGVQPTDFLASADVPGGDAILFPACSGAKTENLDSATQWPPEQRDQYDQLDAAGWGSIDVVLLSIGGNDADFSPVVRHCLLSNCAADSTWQNTEIGRLTQMRDAIVRTNRELRSYAPNAELYEVNYPNPLEPNPSDCIGIGVGVSVSVTTPSHLGWIGIPSTTLSFERNEKIDTHERKWLGETFIPRVNQNVASAATATGAHLIDISDAFRDHPVCGHDPYANGLRLGNDVAGIGNSGVAAIGNESFHPNIAGHNHLFDVIDAQVGEQLGRDPNPSGYDVPSGGDPNSMTVTVLGPNDSDVFVSSGSGNVSIQHGPHNEVIVVPGFSLGTVIGTGRTDDDGNAEIPVHLGPNTAPGIHHVELWTASGQVLGSAPVAVVTTPSCQGTPDVDGDGLADACDGDPVDGPDADADGDGVANADDDCPLVADAAQADADDDGQGDACDADQGADPIATGLRGGVEPQPATATPPEDVAARATGAHNAVVSWSPPAEDGGAPVQGYRITVVETGATFDAPAGTSAAVDGLPAASTLHFGVRALTAHGTGATGLSSSIRTEAEAPGSTSPVPGSGTPPASAGRPATAASVPAARPVAKTSIDLRRLVRRMALHRGVLTLTFKVMPGATNGLYTITPTGRAARKGPLAAGSFVSGRDGRVRLRIRLSRRAVARLRHGRNGVVLTIRVGAVHARRSMVVVR